MANEIITALKEEIINKVTRVHKEFSYAANCQTTLQTISDILDELGVGGPPGPPGPPVDFLAMDVRDYFTDAASYQKANPGNFPRFNITRENDDSGDYQAWLAVTTNHLGVTTDATNSLVRLLHKSEAGSGHFRVYLLTHHDGHPVVQFQVSNFK